MPYYKYIDSMLVDVYKQWRRIDKEWLADNVYAYLADGLAITAQEEYEDEVEWNASFGIKRPDDYEQGNLIIFQSNPLYMREWIKMIEDYIEEIQPQTANNNDKIKNWDTIGRSIFDIMLKDKHYFKKSAVESKPAKYVLLNT